MITSVARGTPATPFDVSMNVKHHHELLRRSDISICAAWAMVSDASTR